jgi:hypothetical protein
LRCVEQLADKYSAGSGRKSREDKLAVIMQQMALQNAI